MSQYYTVITDIGQAKLANATALGETVELTALAVGDGGGELPVPESDIEALVNQRRSASINQVSVDPENANYIVCEQVIPEDVGGWWIREVGVFDVDGDLIAYGNFPETYKPQLEEGSGRTQTIRVVIMISDTEAITLKIDPSVVLATRDYVDSERSEHEESRNHPGATTSAKGFVELATQAEVEAGTDTTRAVTPSRLASSYASRSKMVGMIVPRLGDSPADDEVVLDGASYLKNDLPELWDYASNSGNLGAADANFEDIDADTFRVPDLVTDERFLRSVAAADVGREQLDQMQRITGSMESGTNDTGYFDRDYAGGALSASRDGSLLVESGSTNNTSMDLNFDSADSPNARTGDETRPINTGVLPCMKAGRIV